MVKQYGELYLDARRALLAKEDADMAGMMARHLLMHVSGKRQEEIVANRELYAAHLEGKVTKQGRVYADGDILYAQISGGGEAYAEKQVQIDGLTLSPLVKFYQLPKEIIETTRQKILF